MAITLLQERKKQRNLIFVLLIVIILGIFAVAWQGFILKPALSPPETSKVREIKINFEALKSPLLQELQVFEEISHLEEKIGRENPFLPY